MCASDTRDLTSPAKTRACTARETSVVGRIDCQGMAAECGQLKQAESVAIGNPPIRDQHAETFFAL
jgi:hypothetical protein